MDEGIAVNVIMLATELTKLYFSQVKTPHGKENPNLKGKSVDEVFCYFASICRKELCLSRDYQSDDNT